MRVLHVTHYWERVGGAEVHMHSLALELERRGHECAFFAGSTETELDTPRTRVVRRPYFPHANMLRDAALCSELLRFVRAFQPDLIHVHKLVAFPVEVVLALRACRVPLIHSIYDYSLFCPNGWCVWPDGTVCGGGPGRKCFEHGCETNHRYDARVVLATHMRFRLMRRAMDAFVCPTEHLAEMCRSHLFRGVHTLPYYPPHEVAAQRADVAAQDADVAAQRADVGRTSTHERDRILCVSRLEKEKGVSILLEAFALLLAGRPAVRLSLVGSGPEEARLRARAAELGLGSAVEFHGSVSLDELPVHLARASVLVMPSIWCEALPLIAFDALAAGLPMVASDIGGIPTIVREGITGLLARPRDPADFARQLGAILSDDALRARLAEGCRADLSRYARAQHLDRIEEIYGGIRDKPRAPRDPGPSVLGGERRAILDRLVVRMDELETELAKGSAWLAEIARDSEAAKESANQAVAHNKVLAAKIAHVEARITQAEARAEVYRQLVLRLLRVTFLGRVARARLRRFPGMAEFLE